MKKKGVKCERVNICVAFSMTKETGRGRLNDRCSYVLNSQISTIEEESGFKRREAVMTKKE